MKTILFTAVLITSFFYSPKSQADTVDSAFLTCAVLDNTGMLSQPCKVDAWDSAVDITLDMNSSEARKLCVGIKDLTKENGYSFDRGWKLRIYSPYSNGNTIAQCNL